MTNEEVKEIAVAKDLNKGPPIGKVSVLLKNQKSSPKQDDRPMTPEEKQQQLLDEQQFIEQQRKHRHSEWSTMDGEGEYIILFIGFYGM